MAKLTAADRRKLAEDKDHLEENFVFPEKAPGSGSYPIPDSGHARSALSYGSRYLPPDKLEYLRYKVKFLFPWIKVRNTQATRR